MNNFKEFIAFEKRFSVKINFSFIIKFDKIMDTNSISLTTRKKFLKSYIWSVALFGQQEKNRLEVFEMWCFEKMFKISWTERVTNEEVLNKIKEKRQLWKSFQCRRKYKIKTIIESGV